MRILVIWEPYPDAQVHEDGYQDSRQVIMKDDYQRVDDFGELIGKRIEDVRRNEQDDIIFELSEDKEVLKRTIAILVAGEYIQREKASEAYGLAIKLSRDHGDVYEDPFNYETVDGKWWLFFMDMPVSPLSDTEAANVIWGDAVPEEVGDQP